MEQLTQVLADTLQAIRQSAGRSSLPTTTVEIPRFDPLQEDNGAVKWCEEVDKLAETFQWTGCELLARATSGLTGEAKTWFLSWQPEAKSWENLKTELCNLYPPKKNLSERFRKAGLYTSENATSYCEYARQKILLLRALNFNLSERTMLELVVGDITDAQVKIAAFNSKVETIADLLTLLSQYELTTPAESSSAKRVKRTDPVESGQQSKLCYTCNKPGHLSRFCLKNRNRETKNESKPFGKNVNCSFCGKAGHFANRCFLKQRREKQSGPANVRCFSVKLDDEFCTEFIIQGMKVNCLIDTGAKCSLISSRVAKKLACHLEPDFTMLRGIGGTLVPTLYKTTLRIEREGTAFMIHFYVVEHSLLKLDAILGRDLLTYKGVKICSDSRGTQIYLDDHVKVEPKVVQVCSVSDDLINTPLKNGEADLLRKLLSKFSNYITTGNSVAAITTAELEIKLKTDKIICYNPYRMPLCEREKVKTIVDDLLKNGIIRESTSPFASPVLLVHKKDGGSRLCVDYRALNEITVKDRFPLPRIDDQIDQLGRAKYFTTLDMAAGFHQIPVAENSVEKTAFVTPDGHYEYLRVPFGLSNAPAVFQRAICKALGKLKDHDALIYLDGYPDCVPNCTRRISKIRTCTDRTDDIRIFTKY
jgi:hypothetical protein